MFPNEGYVFVKKKLNLTTYSRTRWHSKAFCSHFLDVLKDYRRRRGWKAFPVNNAYIYLFTSPVWLLFNYLNCLILFFQHFLDCVAPWIYVYKWSWIVLFILFAMKHKSKDVSISFLSVAIPNKWTHPSVGRALVQMNVKTELKRDTGSNEKPSDVVILRRPFTLDVEETKSVKSRLLRSGQESRTPSGSSHSD